MNFDELGLNDHLLDGLDAMGFQTATPIQEKAIPAILDGRDLIACAQTGTGKTAAFLLPILHRVTETESSDVTTLVLVPTRELAVQIDQQLEGFAYFTPVRSIAIYGGRDGTSFDQEKKALSSGANVIIATPGRLIGHLNLGYVKMDKLTYLILDEADRMLDMGFIFDIQKIISYLPAQRQTLMFSATMPPRIRKFAKEILNDPVQISFAVSKPAENVRQAVYEANDSQKPILLRRLLEGFKDRNELVVIFSATKSNVKLIAATLKKKGLNVGEIHSDLEQEQREDILRQFRNSSINVLVATDILSRGIDVKNIKLVVNYDVPGDAEDYVHRVGRTARADADGEALTFINRRDRRKFDDIEALIEAKVERLPLPEDIAAIQEAPQEERGRGGARGRSGGDRRGGSGGSGDRSRGGGGDRRGSGGGERRGGSSDRRGDRRDGPPREQRQSGPQGEQRGPRPPATPPNGEGQAPNGHSEGQARKRKRGGKRRSGPKPTTNIE